MKKSSYIWLFVVIALSVLLAISVVLGLTGYYFSVSYRNFDSDLVVGESAVVPVKTNEATVISYTFDGGYLPEENIPQVIQVELKDLERDVFLRVKAAVFGGDEEFNFITTEHFIKEEDGYYYYDQVLTGGNKISFCNFIKFPLKSNFEPNRKYVLSLVFETLSSELEVEKIWKRANNG